MEQKFITEPAKQIPVLMECDVVVVGGGTAGVIAAIAAGRQGVKTVLIEKLGALGGLLTVGMNTKPSGRLLGGIALECWERAQKEGLAGKNPVISIKKKDGTGTSSVEISSACDAEGMKMLSLDMCVEAGVRILFETMAVAPVMEGKTVAGVLVESKSGRQAIKAKVVVDCSSDADIAVAAGAPFVLGKNGPMQPVSMFFKVNQVDMGKFVEWLNAHPEQTQKRYIDKDPAYGIFVTGFADMLRQFQKDKGVSLQRETVTLKTAAGASEVYCNNTRVRNSSGVDVLDISDAIIELYRQIKLNAQFLKENVGGFENSYINGIVPTLGVRETRHILAEHDITEEEGMGKGRFEDSIGADASLLDFHSLTGTDSRFEAYPPYEIPFRALLPKEAEQVIVAGRVIGSSHEAHGRTRTIPACMTTGQAAGIAAALAVKSGKNVRNVDVKELQNMIRATNMPIFVSELS